MRLDLNIGAYVSDPASGRVDEFMTKLAPARTLTRTLAQLVDEVALLGEEGCLAVGDVGNM